MKKDNNKLDITINCKINDDVINQINQRWEAIIAASPDGIGIVNLKGEVIYCSDKLIAMYGFNKDEFSQLIGKSMFDFIVMEHRALLKDNFQKLISGKTEPHVPEYIGLRKDKSTFYVEVNATLLTDANAKTTGILFIERDITAQRQVTEELLKSEEKYRMFIDDASEAFFQGDAQGNVILVNQAACELTAYNEDELLKMNLKDLFLEEDLINTPLKYDLLDQGKTIKTERKIKRKDGTVVFIEMNSKQLPNGTYQSFINNINERKQAEEAIKESNNKINLLVNNLRGVAYRCLNDRDWTMEYMSNGIFELTGYSSNDFIGNIVRSYNSIIVEEDRLMVW